MDQTKTIGFDLTQKHPSAFPLTGWVSLALPPFLIGLLCQRGLTQSLLTLGRLSEGIFQGYQLPNQPFPSQGQGQQTSNL